MNPSLVRTRTPKPSVLEGLDVQEQLNMFNHRQTTHQDVVTRSVKHKPMDVSARRHYYRNSLVVSEPVDCTGDNLVNTGEEIIHDEESD